MAVYAIVVWLLAGLATHSWWMQLGCFVVSCYLVIQINNVHVLIRIYSRMVSAIFLAMYCTACFLFSSLQGAITLMLLAACLLLLFTTYQDRDSTGRSYYTFLTLSLASLVFPQVLYFTPILWMLMFFNLQCMSWKTWSASLLGLLTPYWTWAGWQLYANDLTPLVTHLERVADLRQPFDYSVWSLPQLLVLIYLALLAITGAVHFLRHDILDKIRTRMLYGCLIWLSIATAVFLVLQPQHYDMLTPVMVLTTAPLIGHYLALTNTKWTNISFYVIAAATLVLTIFNLTWSL